MVKTKDKNKKTKVGRTPKGCNINRTKEPFENAPDHKIILMRLRKYRRNRDVES
jgi:predicted ribosome quality control (RQC) complex YloA/Tae2 family protein